MADNAGKLIDKLKLERLDIDGLIKVIDYKTPLPREWSLNDQLGAIELLGYTANIEALTYLRKIYKPNVVVKQSIDWDEQEGSARKDVNLVQHHNYLNANGPLAEALHYEVPLFKGKKSHLKRLKPAEELKNDHRNILDKSLAHVVIRRAIERLQKTVVSYH